jgi:hypothetical protein
MGEAVEENREWQRLRYLQAMGLVSYIPRRILPGAKPSEQCDWPEGLAVFDTLADTLHKPDKASGSVDESVFARLQRDLAGKEKPASKRKDVSDDAAHDTKALQSVNPESRAELIQFQLTLFQPRPDLLLLVKAQEMESKHIQLLKNILFAIGIKQTELVPLDNFHWPPALRPSSGQAVRGTNKNLPAAQETLHALLEGYQRKMDIKQILMFDQRLGNMLFPETVAKAFPLYVLPGLQDMLNDAHHKKICWQQIRHLV